MSVFQQIYNATRQVLRERFYLAAFFVIGLFFFGLFIFIPLVTIPANTLALQLKIFRSQDYVLMIFLALLVGLNFSMQIYSFRHRDGFQSAAEGATAGVSGIFAAVVGTASCLSCLASLFALVGLGLGSAVFVLQNQVYFLLGAIVLMLIPLYLTAKKINKACVSC